MKLSLRALGERCSQLMIGLPVAVFVAVHGVWIAPLWGQAGDQNPPAVAPQDQAPLEPEDAIPVPPEAPAAAPAQDSAAIPPEDPAAVAPVQPDAVAPEQPGAVAPDQPAAMVPRQTGERAWMGVFLRPRREGGLRVTSVDVFGPSAKAGLKRGDIILRAGGRDVSTLAQMQGVLDALQPGETLALVVLRGGREEPVDLVLGAQPDGRAIAGQGAGTAGRSAGGAYSQPYQQQQQYQQPYTQYVPYPYPVYQPVPVVPYVYGPPGRYYYYYFGGRPYDSFYYYQPAPYAAWSRWTAQPGWWIGPRQIFFGNW